MALTRASWFRLTAFLTSEAEPLTVLSFEQIERILGHALPTAARKHDLFWSNTSSYSWAWRDAGREVSHQSVLPVRISFRLSAVSEVLSPPTQQHPLHSAREFATQFWGIGAADADWAVLDPDVLLVGQDSREATPPPQARDRETPDLFSKRRRYADQCELPWFVLSAEHGLLRLDDVVAPYGMELGAQLPSYRRAWGTWVMERLRRELGELSGVRLEVHAGDAFAEALVEPALTAGVRLTRPLEGLSRGEQLTWYLAHPGLSDGSNVSSSDAAAANEATNRSAADVRRAADVLDAGSFVTSLRDPTLAIPLSDLNESQVPLSPGLYCWWVDASGAAALTLGLGHRVDAGLLFAGQAGATRWPSGRPSPNTLRSQLISMHRDGSVNFSTFRRTLMAGLPMVAAEKANELALTEWMRLHLTISWCSTADADGLAALEGAVLILLDPVLNLRGLPGNDLRRELRNRRSKRGVLAAPLPAPEPWTEP